MNHTNESYDHESDRTSVARIPSNEPDIPSPKFTPQTSSASANAGSLTPNSVSFSTIDINQQNEIISVPDDTLTENKQVPLADGEYYYSLKHLQEGRRGQRDEDSKLPQCVKRFYKNQDELIDVYKRMNDAGTGNEAERDAYQQKKDKEQRMSKILTNVSLVANIALFILKIVAAVISHSLSVVSSVIDSAVDLATSVILIWTWRAIKKRDLYQYPQGRTRLEPIAIVILSVIMCAASVLVIYESINTISNGAGYFTEVNTTKTLTEIDMSALPISAMAVTIVSKAILFFLCYRIKTPAMSALSSDHQNDVASNIVALICGLIGSFAYKKSINEKLIFIDPIGAILISLYIIFTWIRQANGQVKRLTGLTADPRFLSQITWITYHHSPLIEKIDTVRAFYFGTSFLVEVDIVLREDMMLKQAHDIGESLQKKIEELPEVERAFVHLDHEYSHNPGDEHRVV
ncbi:unnamed protein product [Rotaria magnacalcarata]|uniref:Cation efflux protein cytoplasmic domain-containing protein n=2 Tax=Rotaria magnacalcarata TaxID=392030 RepID=A0A816KK03_9BILA|nr:unnamed protein product [Rotaria magnacalcarata]